MQKHKYRKIKSVNSVLSTLCDLCRFLRPTRCLVALAALVWILTLLSLNVAKGEIEGKTHAIKLGAYLAGRHAQYVQDAEAAIKYYRSTLSSNPENTGIQTRILSILVSKGNIKASLPLAEKLIDSDAESVNLATLVLALRDIRAGRFSKAITKLDRLPDDGINAFSAPILKAWCLAAQKNYDAALKTLELRMSNPGVVALFGPHAGLIAELAGKRDAGEIYFKEAAKHFRQIGANLTRLLGGFYERTNQPIKAKALYQNYIKANPNSSLFDIALKGLTTNYSNRNPKLSSWMGIAEALLSLSRSFQRQNSYEAIIFARLAIFVNPEFSFAKLRLADELIRNDNVRDALTIYKSLSKDPFYGWTGRLRLARAYNFLNKIDSAEKVLMAMAKEDRHRIDALVSLGSIYRGRMQYRKAVNAFKAAKKRIKTLEFRHWQLLYWNAASHERLKEWPVAEKDFVKALELNPDEPTILNYLGYSWVEQGKNLDQARKMIENAVKQKPQAGYMVDSLGWVLYRMGDFKGAVKNLERAVLLNPADPTINDHLGDVYWQVERKLEARYQWQRALSLEPEKSQIPIIKLKIKEGFLKNETRKNTLR